MHPLADFFNAGPFMPHGHCYFWTGGLVALHAVSDTLTALAYYSIPVTLIAFVRRRRDLDFHWMFVCFAVFILACGTTHLLEVWNIWHGNYWLAGGFKAATALASVPTAVLLVRLLPQALALPSPTQLRVANETLRAEVAERERANDSLRHSEQRFRLLVESVRDYAIFRLDPEGRVVSWNAGAARIKGYSVEEIIGRHFSVFYPAEDIAGGKPQAELQAAVAEGRHEEEGWRLHKDGTRFWANVVISAIRDDAGTLRGFAKVTRDVTARRQTEELLRRRTEELARSEARRQGDERLQAVIEHLSEGLVISDLEGNLLHWNHAASEMHGFSHPHEFRERLADDQNPCEMLTLDGSPLPFEQWPLARICRGETLHNLELRLRHLHAGRERTFAYNGGVVRDAGGASLAFLSIIDITERKRAEAEILQLNDELEQRVARRTAELQAANRELESFSYSVSHDLRAPLRAIDGYSLILLEDDAPRLDEEGRRVLGVVRGEARRMGQLVDELLAFSRLGRQALHRSAVDMTALARAAFAEAAPPAAASRAIAWSLENLPPAVGDATLLRQVWANLLSNALKFTRERTPAVITVSGTRGDGENLYRVRDNGAGFDMRYVDKLFGVFQRLHTEDEFEGTGVGLAIAQRIIERHGGRIWAEGKPEEGAAFHFALPQTEGTPA